MAGKVGDIFLEFEYNNKRFYTPSDNKEKNKRYSWDKCKPKDLSYSERLAVDFLESFE